MSEIFIINDEVSHDEHEIDNLSCSECWTGFPKICKKYNCTGLVHASFGDENYDGDYWLYTKCDKCGGAE